MATRTQLAEAELVDEFDKPVKPWHPIQGPSDASTMWYAVLRKRERGVFIGTLCIRHTGRQASLESARLGGDPGRGDRVAALPARRRRPKIDAV